MKYANRWMAQIWKTLLSLKNRTESHCEKAVYFPNNPFNSVLMLLRGTNASSFDNVGKQARHGKAEILPWLSREV